LNELLDLRRAAETASSAPVTAAVIAEDLQNAQDELRSASADLQDNVDRLQSENWRDVVPDIEQSSSDVDYAQENSESASQDVADTLEEQ
jgi:hypothetical protein